MRRQHLVYARRDVGARLREVLSRNVSEVRHVQVASAVESDSLQGTDQAGGARCHGSGVHDAVGRDLDHGVDVQRRDGWVLVGAWWWCAEAVVGSMLLAHNSSRRRRRKKELRQEQEEGWLTGGGCVVAAL
jgi:hypothetical protein